MGIEEFLETLGNTGNRWLARMIVDDILNAGWSPEIVITTNITLDLELRKEIEHWCRMNCENPWFLVMYRYWLFSCEKEAIHFKTVWG